MLNTNFAWIYCERYRDPDTAVLSHMIEEVWGCLGSHELCLALACTEMWLWIVITKIIHLTQSHFHFHVSRLSWVLFIAFAFWQTYSSTQLLLACMYYGSCLSQSQSYESSIKVIKKRIAQVWIALQSCCWGWSIWNHSSGRSKWLFHRESTFIDHWCVFWKICFLAEHISFALKLHKKIVTSEVVFLQVEPIPLNELLYKLGHLMSMSQVKG